VPGVIGANRAAEYCISNINRGATPMRAALHGLLRVFQVLRRPGRARTLAGRARLRFAAPDSTASQALSNARPSGSRSLPGRLRTPRTAARARGRRPEKPSADRGAAKATRTMNGIGSMPVLVLVWVAGTSPRKAEGFFGLPQARFSVRGAEMSGVKNAAEGAFFRACEGGSTSEASWADGGASPSSDTGAP
jgi:hypothetical protein